MEIVLYLNLLVAVWYPLLWAALIILSLLGFEEDDLHHGHLTEHQIAVQNLAWFLIGDIGVIVAGLWIVGMLFAIIHPVLTLALFVVIYAIVAIVSDC